MSTLTNIEKRKLERILGMSSGYVLDFSNRTFSEFVTDSTGREIYDSRYDSFGGSKANRLRGFWAAEGNHNVGKLLARIPRSAQERCQADSSGALKKSPTTYASRRAHPIDQFLLAT